MFDIGIWEMAIVGIVALIVVGPEDLPKMFRTVGVQVGKARSMARQFQNAMNDAARQAELQDVKKAVDSVAQGVKAASDPFSAATKSAKGYANSLMTEIDPEVEELKQFEPATPAVDPHPDELPDPVPTENAVSEPDAMTAPASQPASDPKS